MRPALFRLTCLAALCGAAGGTAQSPKGPDLKHLDDLKAKFAAAEAKEREAFLKKFDAVARSVAADKRLAPEVMVRRQAVVAEQKKAFERDGTLPGCDDMLPALWDHLSVLHAARRPVARAYDDALRQLAKAVDTEAGPRLAREKAGYDEQLPGRDTFRPKTSWRGQRTGPAGDAVDFDFRVGECEGNVVKGRVWQDRGVVEMLVEGRLDGNFVEVRTVKMVTGAARSLVFKGFVMEDRLVLQVSGTGAGGKPASGLVLLARDKK